MDTLNEGSCQKLRRRRASATGFKLNEASAAIAKGMLLRGDPVQFVSSYHGVNSARIDALITGKRFPHVTAAAAEMLPPPGPYLPFCAVREAETALTSARRAIDLCATLLGGSQGDAAPLM